MPTSARPTYDAVRAVHRVCKILNTFADAPDRTVLNYVAEAANVPEELCTPPSGGTRISALRGTSRGVRLLPPGLTFRPPSIAALERLAEAARPALDQLHGEIAETTNLGILDGTPGGAQRRVVGVPAHMRLAAQVRACGHVHCTTLGKAILIESHISGCPPCCRPRGCRRPDPLPWTQGCRGRDRDGSASRATPSTRKRTSPTEDAGRHTARQSPLPRPDRPSRRLATPRRPAGHPADARLIPPTPVPER